MICVGGPMDGAEVPEDKVYNGILYSGIDIAVASILHGVFHVRDTFWEFTNGETDSWVEYIVEGERAYFSYLVRR